MKKEFDLSKMRSIKLKERFSVLKNLEFINERSRPLYEVEFPTDRISVIAEVKKSSPNAVFNTNADPARQALLYEKGGADAVSVLVDNQFFSGSWKDLSQAAQAVKIPVLCKEFIYSTVQIDLAYLTGADMVLLIAQVLTFNELSLLAKHALMKNVKPVIEINTIEEIDRVLMLGPEYVMVNMRNLNTLELDVKKGMKVLNELPDTVTKISASAMNTADDIREVYENTNCKVFLVGSSLMKSSEPAALLKSMKQVIF
jgi:indole-3-glycerol phosphate synthase